MSVVQEIVMQDYLDRIHERDAEILRLKGELAEATKLLSEGRDHLRQLVALANTNNATKELLRYIGNTFNAFLQKHEKGAS